ncbi:EAL domain-containing protein [Verticiella sediminum]|uniref:EAL domain-containing protein n=1 Tax=Verticiella sediminum TaxID=1247510 RepID=A0A556ASA0_9BURK|nr:GGDEF domain-containing phosphodiesterase [Verticiella sediminum]TSH95819.1 EAL domain-containing protein [Verticiella sediminum]
MPESVNAKIEPREQCRLEALAAYRVLDTPPEDDLDRLVRLAVGLFNVPIAAIALIDSNRLFLKASAGLPAGEIGYERPGGRGVFDLAEPLIIPDLREQGLNHPFQHVEPAVAFCAAVPLDAPEGTQLGVFLLLDTRRRDDFDLARVDRLGELARLALERLEIRRLDAACRISRARLEFIARGSPDAVLTCDDTGRLVFWNAGAQRLFGLTDTQAPGLEFASLLEAPSAAVFLDQLQALRRVEAAHAYAQDKLLVVQRRTGNLLLEVNLSRWWEAGCPAYSIIARDVSARNRREARLLGMANFDALTELPNAAMFRRALSGLMGANQPFALLLLGMEGLKAINDERGARVGDAALRSIGHRLRLFFSDDAILARLAGAEFGIALQGETEPDRVAGLCRGLFDALAEPLVLDGVAVELGCCVGVAFHPADASEVEGLMGDADLALYEARRQGDDSCRFFVPQLREAVVRRKKLTTELRSAIELGQFELFYQPQVDLHTREVIGAEALLRWRHPVAGVLLPEHFLAVLETLPNMQQVGRWILTSACRQAAVWRRVFPRFRISVNLFPAQLHHEQLLHTVQQALNESGLPPQALVLEVTEHTVLKPNPRLSQALADLCHAGVGVAFDDYGTGYASLSLLKRLPVTRLKLDRAFVANVPGDLGDAAVIQAVLYLGGRFRLDVIAEGIENEAQARFLREHGCGAGQGNHYGEPVPAPEFATRFLGPGPRPELATPRSN